MATTTVGRGARHIRFTYDGDILDMFSGFNEVEWGYTLNVARFPTYKGEVVQILSCYVDDISASGTVQSYAEMEAIYDFFLKYISEASQGTGGTAYNQVPMTMQYPHRGWSFDIIPTALPGYRYGRDVVTPEWQLTAFVRDAPTDLSTLIIQEAQIKDRLETQDAGFSEQFGLEGKIRFTTGNPFSGLLKDTAADADENAFSPEQKKRFDEAADFYNSLIPKYMEGDFATLTGGLGSKPTNLGRGTTPADSSDTDPNGQGTAGQQNKVDKARKK
jgi:hypothetical protein